MPKLKKVTVQFIYEGISYPKDFVSGALLPDGRVLVTIDNFSLYDCVPTDYPDIYIVDLDVNDIDQIGRA
ncbi:hypothetical protein, partial [Bacillus sp. mrc49]|uniref:hypothetical protein n=1 Tax=Bacillus sp. mrc49 TaxID=2054913 RepID=UPI000CAEB81F